MIKIKLITGFRKDQEVTIDADEAHKAYYAFFNPETRVVFKDGTALIGADIRRIVPDYSITMGWGRGYTPDFYDYAELKNIGIDVKIKDILNEAKQIALSGDQELCALPLNEAVQKLSGRVLLLDETTNDTGRADRPKQLYKGDQPEQVRRQ
jgi:hypothetical protein